MPRIVKVVQIRYGAGREYAVATVLTDDNDTVDVYIGGDLEVWFDDKHNKAKGHIKRNKVDK